MLCEPLREQLASHRARQARMNAPREIATKATPRPFRPTDDALCVLQGIPEPKVIIVRKEASVLPFAGSHITAYRRYLAKIPVEDRRPKYPTIAKVVKAVAEVSGVTEVDMLSERRTASVVFPRHVAMYLCRTMTLRSFPAIGMYFGRDHTTQISACRKIERLMTAGDVTTMNLIASAKELITA